MLLAVVGAGALGGIVGGRLQNAGHSVSFVARGATLAALRTDGLRIDSIDGDLVLPHVVATDDPATIGAVDVVLVCVKSTQVAGIAPTLLPLIGPATAVIPLQNGVESSAMLARVLGNEHVMDGLARVITELVAPAHILHTAVTPIIEFGPRRVMPATALARTQIAPFAEAMRAAGMHAVLPEDMEQAVWEKFLFIEPFGTVGAATRVPIGVMRSVAETRALLNTCLHEVHAVAAAVGVTLSPDAIARTWKRYDGLPPGSMASMQRDLMAGRASEFDLQTGAVVRLGREHGVPTPAHDVLHAMLAPAVQQEIESSTPIP